MSAGNVGPQPRVSICGRAIIIIAAQLPSVIVRFSCQSAPSGFGPFARLLTLTVYFHWLCVAQDWAERIEEIRLWSSPEALRCRRCGRTSRAGTRMRFFRKSMRGQSV